MTERHDATDPIGILEDHTPAELYSPPDAERQKVHAFLLHFEEARQYRQPWDRQWELNRLYIKGQQLILRNRTTGEVFRLPQDDNHRLLAVNNILRPTARILLGKLTRTVPTWRTMPASADLNDIRGADVANSLLDYHRRNTRLDRWYIDAYRDVIVAGIGHVKLSWDPEKGNEIDACLQCGYNTPVSPAVQEEVGACPRCAAEAQQQFDAAQEQTQLLAQSGVAVSEAPQLAPPIQMQRQREGEVVIESIDYRDFFMPPAAVTHDEAQWCCHRRVLSVSELRRLFPDKAKYIAADPGIHAEQNVTLLQNTVSANSGTTRMLEDHAYLYEFHEKPTSRFKKGRIVRIVNNMIVEEIESPYHVLGRFPFFSFYWEKNRGEFLGESFLDQAWTIQRELNMLLTQLREQRELTARPKLLTPIGSQISKDEIDTTAGQLIYYNSMVGTPKYLETPPFPNYTYQELERLQAQVQLQASVMPQDLGGASTEQSGRYAAIMEALASQQVGAILRYNMNEFRTLGVAVLQLCQQFYTPERTWTVVGSDMPVTNTFADMHLNPGYDVDVQEDDSLSTNHAVRLEQALSLWNAGLFTDPATGLPDRKTFAQVARLRIPGVGPATKAADHARAAAIPELLAQGQPYQPKDWDDPDIFAEELLAWLKGPGTNESPQLVEQVAGIWRIYMRASQAALQQQMAMQLQSNAGGKPKDGAAAASGGTAGGSAPAVTSDPSVLPEAAGIADQADTHAESAARSATAHES